jgi:hypothetical protein
MYSLKQEGKHQFLRDLSRNVSRGQISNAQRGFLCGQAAPYGYDRMLLDEHGVHLQRVHNGQKVVKPRGCRTTLVRSDDGVKVDTVQWLFQSYADTDIGLRGLADQLNARDVPGPTGGHWFAASIKAIFENRNYTGILLGQAAGRQVHSVSAGKFTSATGAVRYPQLKAARHYNPREAWIVVEGAHEALNAECCSTMFRPN